MLSPGRRRDGVTNDSWKPKDPALLPGFELWRAGALSDALQFFVTAAKPEASACAWRGLGSVLWTLGRFDESLAAFQRALERDCYNAVHWANVGLVLRDLGRREPAINVFRVAASLDPGYEPAFNEWANVLYDEGRFAEALQLYDHALSLDATRAVVHHNRGVCLIALKRRDDALRSFHAALARDPSYVHTLNELERHRM
jgi:tetratricopeptide (TPR) repeat protein